MPSKHITKVFQNHGTMIRCQVLEAAIDFGIATPAIADQEKELTEDVLNQVPRRPRSSQPIVRDTLLRYNGHNGPVIDSYAIASQVEALKSLNGEVDDCLASLERWRERRQDSHLITLGCTWRRSSRGLGSSRKGARVRVRGALGRVGWARGEWMGFKLLLSP